MIADTKPGHYYVSVVKSAKQRALALGPFTNDHAGALAAVAGVKRYVTEHDSFGCFYAFGTVRLELGAEAPAGKLNGVIA